MNRTRTFSKKYSILRSLAALTAMSLSLGVAGCQTGARPVKSKEKPEPEVTVEVAEVLRPAPPPAAAAASAAVTLAANQYIYARLLTEDFLTEALEGGAGVSELDGVLADAQAAWWDTEDAVEATFTLTEAAADDIGRDGTSRGQDAPSSSPSWAEDFARPMSDAELVAEMEFLTEEMAADTARMQDVLVDAQAVLNSGESEASVRSELSSLGRTIAGKADIGVYITSEDVGRGSSLRPLPGSLGALDSEKAFIVEGVDALVLLSQNDAPDILVADNQQVTITPETLEDEDKPVTTVLGLLPVTEESLEANPDRSPVTLIGAGNRNWMWNSRVYGVSVTESAAQTSLTVASITAVTIQEVQVSLESIGIIAQAAPNLPPVQVGISIRIDPRVAGGVLEELNERYGTPRESEREGRVEGRRPAPATEPPAQDAPQGLIPGEYSAEILFPDGDSMVAPATVELADGFMTITIHDPYGASVFQGSFNEVSEVFDGTSSEGLPVTITFNSSSVPVTGAGNLYSPAVGAGIDYYLTKN